MRWLVGRAESAQVDTGSGAALGSVPPGPPRPQTGQPQAGDGALDRDQRARVCGAAERGRAEAKGGKLPSPLRVPVSSSPCRRGRTYQAQALLTQPRQGGARRETTWPGGEAGQAVRWACLTSLAHAAVRAQQAVSSPARPLPPAARELRAGRHLTALTGAAQGRTRVAVHAQARTTRVRRLRASRCGLEAAFVTSDTLPVYWAPHLRSTATPSASATGGGRCWRRSAVCRANG